MFVKVANNLEGSNLGCLEIENNNFKLQYVLSISILCFANVFFIIV